MASLEKRLQSLEASLEARSGRAAGYRSTPRIFVRYFHELENYRRRQAGLPTQALPYTEEDRADDEKCLRELIPAYRASASAQSEEMREFLDQWEASIREDLQRGGRR